MWILYGYGMITGLMATLHGTFQLLAAVGQWREMGSSKFDRAVDQCSSTMRALLRHEKRSSVAGVICLILPLSLPF